MIATNPRRPVSEVPHTVIMRRRSRQIHPAQVADDDFSPLAWRAVAPSAVWPSAGRETRPVRRRDGRAAADFPDWTAVVTGRVTAEHQAFAGDLRRRIAAAGLADRIVFPRQVPDIKLWYRRIRLCRAVAQRRFRPHPARGDGVSSPVVASDAGAYADLSPRRTSLSSAGGGAALTRAIPAYLSDRRCSRPTAPARSPTCKRFPLQGGPMRSAGCMLLWAGSQRQRRAALIRPSAPSP